MSLQGLKPHNPTYSDLVSRNFTPWTPCSSFPKRAARASILSWGPALFPPQSGFCSLGPKTRSNAHICSPMSLAGSALSSSFETSLTPPLPFSTAIKRSAGAYDCSLPCPPTTSFTNTCSFIPFCFIADHFSPSQNRDQKSNIGHRVKSGNFITDFAFFFRSPTLAGRTPER